MGNRVPNSAQTRNSAGLPDARMWPGSLPLEATESTTAVLAYHERVLETKESL